jgi:hypothetical protein
MAMPLEEIKQLSSVDLEDFEIRGVKYGIGNASTTGPVYLRGTYEPSRNLLTGAGSLDASDSPIISGISFDPPFSSYSAFVLKTDDYFTIDSTQYTVSSIIDATSLELSDIPGFAGSTDFTSTLGSRDYLVEPDVGNNTTTGDATFTSGSAYVGGVNTAWTTELDTGDVIRPDSYQQYMHIKNVHTDTVLELETPYTGNSVVDSYTAKRVKLNRTYLQYTKNEFTYDKDSARWAVTDSTTGSLIPASSAYALLVDGISMKLLD